MPEETKKNKIEKNCKNCVHCNILNRNYSAGSCTFFPDWKAIKGVETHFCSMFEYVKNG